MGDCYVGPLRRYLADQLNEDEVRAVELHAEGCRHCADALARLAAAPEARPPWLVNAAAVALGVGPKAAGEGPGIGASGAGARNGWHPAALHDPDGARVAGPPESGPAAEASRAEGGAGEDDRDGLKGQVIGPYAVEKRLGRGGFGTVYRARRSDGQYQQTVALKVLNRGLGGEAVLARFRRERQALAGLEGHPHIVGLLDAGLLPDGRPYFVMEYVEGEPLDQFCDDRRLSLRQRLRLFLQVCAAVQHAHKKLVVHRDLKPANVLAAAGAEGEPTVKLLDFGIAKFLGPEPGEGLTTRVGERPCTPAYASPEQIRGERVDVTSDVYSLGVVLYELLCGHRPYCFDDATAEEVVCRREPEPPSARVGRTETVAQAGGKTVEVTPEVVGQRRRSAPRQLRHQLNGDLDNICLKALEKEPGRRYQSAEELARDVRNYLAGDPVAARGNPWGYRAGKFARKHKVKLGGAAAVLALTLGLLGWALAERGRALTTAVSAQEQRKRAEEAGYAHAMNLVGREWDDGNVRRALQLLDEYGPGSGKEHLRDEAWDRYRWLCTRGALRTLDGHRAEVWGLAFGPGGATLVSGGLAPLGAATETVKVWDASTGRPVGALKGLSKSVASLTPSPDGRSLAAVTLHGELSVWGGLPDEPHRLYALKEPGVRCAAFPPDGHTLVTGNVRGEVKIWELATGRLSAVLPDERQGPGAGNGIRAMALEAGGDALATGHADGSVRLWRLGERRHAGDLLGHEQAVYALAWAPGGRTLASAGEDRTVRLWDPDGRRERRRLTGHRALVRCLAYSPDGETLASGSHDSTVRLWRTATGEVAAVLRGHLDGVTSLAFGPGGKVLATASKDRTVKLWDPARDPEGLTVRRLGGDLHSLAFAPSGDKLNWGATPPGKPGRGRLAELDLTTRRDARVLRPYRALVKGVAHSREGRTIAVSCGNEVHLWDVRAGKERAVLSQKGPVLAVALAPDGRTVATAALREERAVRLWDAGTGAEVGAIPEPLNQALSLAFSPDGRALAVGTVSGAVKLWDVATLRLRLPPLLGHRGAVHAVAFAPRGGTLASAGEDHTVRLWVEATGSQLPALNGHGGAVRCVAFAGDGLMLASGGDDRTVRLWRVGARGEMATLRPPRGGRIQSLAFSPAGARRLAAGCSAGNLFVWEMGGAANEPAGGTPAGLR